MEQKKGRKTGATFRDGVFQRYTGGEIINRDLKVFCVAKDVKKRSLEYLQKINFSRSSLLLYLYLRNKIVKNKDIRCENMYCSSCSANGITVWKNVKFLKIKVKIVVNINSK